MRVLFRSICFMLAVYGCGLGGRAVAFQVAAQPEGGQITAPKLFPDTTLAYFRIADVKQLKQDLDRSTLGKLSSDEQLKPILSEFYGTLVKSTQQIADAVGLDLDQLLSIPSGELAVAVFPGGKPAEVEQVEESEGRQRVRVTVKAPVIAMILDAGDDITNVQVLLQRMDQAIQENSEHLQKNVDRLVLHSYKNNDRSEQQFAYFIDGGTMVACSNVAYIEDLAEVWLGRAGQRKTLADNSKFVSLMSRCVGTDGERPQISFYADPLAMIREFTPKTAGTAFFLALLPPLGIDGIEAVGGSAIISPPDFDSISHLHLSLASPRRAVLALLRPKAGTTVPEPWVPSNAASYLTVNWDIQATVSAVERLVNQFRGDGAFDRLFEAGNRQLEIDIRKDILDNLEGRLTMVQGFVRPITINSGSNVYAIRIKNSKAFENNVLPKVLDKIGGGRVQFESESFGKIKARVLTVPQRGNNQNRPIDIRTPEICVAMIDDFLVISDSRYMMRQLADTLNDPSNQLSESLEFQLINDRIKSQVQDKQPAGISFARPEESLQLFYELARDSKNREAIKRFAQNNPVLMALNETLEKHELPPFSVISKYLTPSGGYFVEEEQGLRYTTFSLKRE